MVHLVNNYEPSVKEMERACMETLVSPTSEASLTVSEKIQKDEEQQVGVIFTTDSNMFQILNVYATQSPSLSD